MALKLFGHDTSPYVRRIRVLLAEKGLAFTRDAAGWSVPDAEVLRLNPMLRVPALVDSEVEQPQVLLDSRLIAAYLYERYPQPPPAPGGSFLPLQATMFQAATRWDDENTLSAIDAALDSAINVFLLDLDGIDQSRAPYLQRQGMRVERCLTWLDERLAGRSTFHDDVYGFLDVALYCALDWMIFRKRYDVRRHANLAHILDVHAQRPALSETDPRKAAYQGLPNSGK